jgi:prolyl 4-hydroxylase
MNYVTYYDNAIDKKLCQEIIDRFEQNIDQQEDTILQGHRSFKEINITKHANWKDVNDRLLDLMQHNLGKYMSQFDVDAKAWPEQVGYEMIRMKRYLPNDEDEFAFHVDVQDYATARRFLVYFFYLNDVEVGGETAFQYNRNQPILKKVKPVAGRLLMFPPLWTHPHIGMKPISGPKYILGGYLHYV